MPYGRLFCFSFSHFSKRYTASHKVAIFWQSHWSDMWKVFPYYFEVIPINICPAGMAYFFSFFSPSLFSSLWLYTIGKGILFQFQTHAVTDLFSPRITQLSKSMWEWNLPHGVVPIEFYYLSPIWFHFFWPLI